MLKYNLTENPLTERPDDYSATVHAMSSLDLNELVTRMVNRGTTVTKTDIIAVMNTLSEVIEEVHLEGSTVNLPLFNTSFSISGVFDGPMDSFDPNRHKLNLNVTKGSVLRSVERNAHVEKTASIAPMPQIQEVKDSVTGSVNEILTSNGVIEVRGTNLKIDGDEKVCGLWFVDGGNEVKAEVIIENKPSRIIAMIPKDMKPSKTWQVRVVTQYSGSILLKSPKTFVFQKDLQIV